MADDSEIMISDQNANLTNGRVKMAHKINKVVKYMGLELTRKPKCKLAPLICAPTTAGVGGLSVVTEGRYISRALCTIAGVTLPALPPKWAIT
jgi:alcohol dehydrogenase class IV